MTTLLLVVVLLVGIVAWLAWAAYKAPELPATDSRGWSDAERREYRTYEGSD